MRKENQGHKKRSEWEYETKTIVYSVDFFFKADLKYVQHVLGAMPASSTNNGLLVEMTSEKAKTFNDMDDVIFITYEDRERWMKESEALFEKEFDPEIHTNDDKINKLRNECANKTHGQKSAVLMRYPGLQYHPGRHAC